MSDPACYERVDVLFGIHHHQMNVQRQVGQFPQCRNDGHPVCEVGNKDSIHHIEVKRRKPSVFESFNFGSQIPEITKQK